MALRGTEAQHCQRIHSVMARLVRVVGLAERATSRNARAQHVSHAEQLVGAFKAHAEFAPSCLTPAQSSALRGLLDRIKVLRDGLLVCGGGS